MGKFLLKALGEITGKRMKSGWDRRFIWCARRRQVHGARPSRPPAAALPTPVGPNCTPPSSASSGTSSPPQTPCSCPHEPPSKRMKGVPQHKVRSPPPSPPAGGPPPAATPTTRPQTATAAMGSARGFPRRMRSLAGTGRRRITVYGKLSLARVTQETPRASSFITAEPTAGGSTATGCPQGWSTAESIHHRHLHLEAVPQAAPLAFVAEPRLAAVQMCQSAAKHALHEIRGAPACWHGRACCVPAA